MPRKTNNGRLKPVRTSHARLRLDVSEFCTEASVCKHWKCTQTPHTQLRITCQGPKCPSPSASAVKTHEASKELSQAAAHARVGLPYPPYPPYPPPPLAAPTPGTPTRTPFSIG